ncbi:hypothetical protein ACN28S_63780 [Cystobacter fuscus]
MAFEQRLKDEAHDAQGGKPAAAPAVQVQVPAALTPPPVATPPARPALRPKPPPPVEFDAPLGDDDKTPPPTPNPFAMDGDEGLPPMDEPKVQVAADLQEEMEATQSRAPRSRERRVPRLPPGPRRPCPSGPRRRPCAVRSRPGRRRRCRTRTWWMTRRKTIPRRRPSGPCPRSRAADPRPVGPGIRNPTSRRGRVLAASTT